MNREAVFTFPNGNHAHPNDMDTLEPLAIVGFSLRFPEAETAESFWSLLMEKRCAMSEFPANRFNIEAFYHPESERLDSLPLRGGHFIGGDLGAFDAPFFSITPAEAAGLDPQQRILLETAYHAIENAGIPLPDIIGSRTSVHTGCFTQDYSLVSSIDHEIPSKYAAIGLEKTMLANRISWFFDLKGPSINLDSACSSSMMALDLACQGLWNGNSTMAIVAGCNLLICPDTFNTMSNMSFLSPDSRCFSFDARANGYARGEGFSVLVIKPLKAAIKNDDTIRAVIRSSGSNQDGRTPGVTQPSKDSQMQLIMETYRKAGLDMASTRYFEAHGTGTEIGDPTEAGAIGAAFQCHTSKYNPLYIGAVKANIGHLEGASGIAGVIKVIVALERGIIPPNTNFETLNPKIDADFLNLRFPTDAIPWPTTGLRRASVNSFGFGGANSHVVLDDAYNFMRIRNIEGKHNSVTQPLVLQELKQFRSNLQHGVEYWKAHTEHVNGNAHDDRKSIFATHGQLLVWSAADEGGLERLATAYKQHFSTLRLPEHEEAIYLRNLAYTLSRRRSLLPWKAFAISASLSSLQDLDSQMSKPIKSVQEPGLAFVFTGQGAQWYAMGRELLVYKAFELSLLNSENLLRRMGCRWTLMDELHKDKSKSNVNLPAYSQPLCTALQLALVDLMRCLGVFPFLVVGHSSGEIAAAYCAGAISAQSALKISYHRGLLAATLTGRGSPSGAMLSVGLSENDAQPYLSNLGGYAAIGCINSPKNVTVTGDEIAINKLQALLDQKSIFARKLQVDVAYHSEHMNILASPYAKALGSLEDDYLAHRAPVMISTVTGQEISREALRKADYWVKNMVSPVKFSQALEKICSPRERPRKKLDRSHRNSILIHALLEIGPHSALQGIVRDTLKAHSGGRDISYTSLLKRNLPAIETTLAAVGHLYCLGISINFGALDSQDKDNCPQTLSNLPNYPFDHSKSFWHESRLSTAYRFRKHPRHDLLGTTVPDWNPMEAKWRNILKASELPWIMDHKISGSTLYPAAGMIVMALEAAYQLADYDSKIVGFTIKDASFHTPLHISSSDGVETNLHLRSTRDSSDNPTSWQFRLFTYVNSGWVENCSGLIQAEYKDPKNEVSINFDINEKVLKHRQICDSYQRGWTTVDSSYQYQCLKQDGFDYGPAFRSLEKISWNLEAEAKANVRLFEWMPESHFQRHIVHPTSLDSILQLNLISLSRGGSTQAPTAIPTFVNRLWVATTGLSPPSGGPLEAYANTHFQGSQVTASMSVLDSNGSLCAFIEDFEFTVIARPEQSYSSSKPIPRLLNTDWKPDLELETPERIMAYCNANQSFQLEPVVLYSDISLLQFWFILNALEFVLKEEKISTALHLQKYISWMKLQAENFRHGTLQDSKPEWRELLNDSDHMKDLCERVRHSGKQGKFVAEVGENLPKILASDLDMLELLFQGDLVKDYYLDIIESVHCVKMMTKYLDAIAHKNPSLRILEVGGGTGGMTGHLLDVLSSHGNGEIGASRYAQYDFTDISRSFFEQAQEKFKNYGGMRFKSLDIESDPLAQGFEHGEYDIVVAASVLHATQNLDTTIQNLHKLLKPGGKLIIGEITKPEKLRLPFVFGLLPGWWRSTDDYRKSSPCITTDVWHRLLACNGFSGSELVMDDFQNPICHDMSIIISTAIGPPAPSIAAQISPVQFIQIIAEKSSVMQQMVASDLKNGLQDSLPNCEINILTLRQAASTPDLGKSLCLYLPEIEKPLLLDLDHETFLNLQKILSSTLGSLWVTCPGEGTLRNPEYGMVDGLLRTLRSEFQTRKIVTLALEATNRLNACNILRVFQTTMSRSIDDYEAEYMERHGMLHISRIIESNKLDAEILRRLEKTERKFQAFGDGPPLKLKVAASGLLDTIQFEELTSDSSMLGPDEIEIEVKAVGVNFKDCLVALGRVNQPTLGVECAGIITRCGESSKGKFKPGDRVAACTLDTFQTYAKAHHQCVVLIPEGITFTTAAALPVNFVTAWYALHDLARLQKGESVLIHSGAGGTGQAAIQIAQYLGASIFTTVGTLSKKQLLMERYKIPEAHIFYSRDTSFACGVKRLTKERGVDVVLNSLAGESLISSWEAIAPYGRFMEIGIKDIISHKALPMYPFARNVSFMAIDLSAIVVERPVLVQRALKKMTELLADNHLSAPYPLDIQPISNVENAFRMLQSGKNSGKIVLEFGKNDEVLTVFNTVPTYNFESNRSYVIAGGLGGLGRTIARWMVTRGAKFLILLSRSGAKSEASLTLVKELKSYGVRVETPACDISDSCLLKSILTLCSQNMPPIKGCIQSSMALDDAVFENMTFKQWKAAVSPKVHGSWNLHKLLPKGIDFFIMLSSITGVIGNAGQANYCAGNAYQDALAHFRIASGETATSLDIGIMESEGFLAENMALQQRMLGTGKYVAISQEFFFSLLDYHCDPSLGKLDERRCQVSFGIEIPANMVHKGTDPAQWMKRPAFRHLYQIRGTNDVDKSSFKDSLDYVAMFKAAETTAEAGLIVAQALVKKLAKIMLMSAEELDPSKPLHIYSVDSLIAVELRNWFAKEFDADVAIFDILGGGTIAMIGKLVAGKSASREEPKDVELEA